MRKTTALSLPILAICIGCKTLPAIPQTERRIYGPDDYTVFWDMPELDYYWIPRGTDIGEMIQIAEACEAQVSSGLLHHIPVPPKYDWHYLRFGPLTSDRARACVIERLGAVPALTVYEK